MAITDRELRIIITAVGADKVQTALDDITSKAKDSSDAIVTGFSGKAMVQMELFRLASDAVGKGLQVLWDQAKEAWLLGMDEVKAQEKRITLLGDMVPALDEWAKTCKGVQEETTAMAKDQVTQFFLLLTNMGLSRDTAFDYALKMGELTGQQAAFQKLAPDEAFNKLSRGITGVGKGLKDLGIVITPAMLQQELLNEQVIPGAKGYDDAQKAIARMAIIMRESKPAIEGFSAQHATLAGQLKAINSRWDDLKTKWGVMIQTSPTVGEAIDKLAFAVSVLSDWMGGTNKGFNDFCAGAGVVIRTLGAIAIAIGWVMKEGFYLGKMIGGALAWGWNVDKQAWEWVTGQGGNGGGDGAGGFMEQLPAEPPSMTDWNAFIQQYTPEGGKGTSRRISALTGLTWGRAPDGSAANPLHVRVTGSGSMSLLEAGVPA